MSRLCATGLVNGEWEQLMAAIFAVSIPTYRRIVPCCL